MILYAMVLFTGCSTAIFYPPGYINKTIAYGAACTHNLSSSNEGNNLEITRYSEEEGVYTKSRNNRVEGISVWVKTREMKKIKITIDEVLCGRFD